MTQTMSICGLHGIFKSEKKGSGKKVNLYGFSWMYDPFRISRPYVTVPGKRAQVAHFFKIELLLPQGRVGFELQNALHI